MLKKIIPLALPLSWGCSNKSKFKIEYYPNGNIKHIYSSKNDTINSKEITFFTNGNVEFIKNYADGMIEGERLHFYEENGLMESKMFFKRDIPNGNAYWFYQSGALRSSRYYVDGKENYVGFDYWDYRIVINKALIRFDDGRVYFKLNFDSGGRPTTKEGILCIRMLNTLSSFSPLPGGCPFVSAL